MIKFIKNLFNMNKKDKLIKLINKLSKNLQEIEECSDMIDEYFGDDISMATGLIKNVISDIEKCKEENNN